MIVRTLMLAVLKAAPENLRENLLRAVGAGIKDQLASLDFGTAPRLCETLVVFLESSCECQIIVATEFTRVFWAPKGWWLSKGNGTPYFSKT